MVCVGVLLGVVVCVGVLLGVGAIPPQSVHKNGYEDQVSLTLLHTQAGFTLVAVGVGVGV